MWSPLRSVGCCGARVGNLDSNPLLACRCLSSSLLALIFHGKTLWLVGWSLPSSRCPRWPLAPDQEEGWACLPCGLLGNAPPPFPSGIQCGPALPWGSHEALSPSPCSLGSLLCVCALDKAVPTQPSALPCTWGLETCVSAMSSGSAAAARRRTGLKG